MIEQILASYLAGKKNYDRGHPSLEGSFAVASECLEALSQEAILGQFGNFSVVNPIAYSVARDGAALSRPFRPELFISDPTLFECEALAFAQAIGNQAPIAPDTFDRVIYTAVTAFSLCVDLWRPKSRKTPGTFFEVLVGSAARAAFPMYSLTKHIPIRAAEIVGPVDALVETCDVDDDEAGDFSGDSVSTDLVITNPATGRGAVIPLKITTRERIVQPFAHQRILDSAYPDRYASFVACISEVQRDDKTNTVKQICVPGTIALFQKHLAKINGLYYCDVPRRYAADDFKTVIPVKRFAALFEDVTAHLLQN